VQEELREAIRTGNVMCNRDTGLLEREANPSRYPAVPAPAGKTREEVRQELREAIRTGDMPAGGETDLKMKDLHPGMYPKK